MCAEGHISTSKISFWKIEFGNFSLWIHASHWIWQIEKFWQKFSNKQKPIGWHKSYTVENIRLKTHIMRKIHKNVSDCRIQFYNNIAIAFFSTKESNPYGMCFPQRWINANISQASLRHINGSISLRVTHNFHTQSASKKLFWNSRTKNVCVEKKRQHSVMKYAKRKKREMRKLFVFVSCFF